MTAAGLRLDHPHLVGRVTARQCRSHLLQRSKAAVNNLAQTAANAFAAPAWRVNAVLPVWSKRS